MIVLICWDSLRWTVSRSRVAGSWMPHLGKNNRGKILTNENNVSLTIGRWDIFTFGIQYRKFVCGMCKFAAWDILSVIQPRPRCQGRARAALCSVSRSQPGPAQPAQPSPAQSGQGARRRHRSLTAATSDHLTSCTVTYTTTTTTHQQR